MQLDSAQFAALPQDVRAALARTRAHPGRPTRYGEEVRRRAHEQTGGGPFVWWPDLLALAGDEPISRRPPDDRAGVVLVWRTESGLATHAAVTLGDGYALTKPSQCWYGPRLVWTVRQTIRHARTPGCRLERWRL